MINIKETVKTPSNALKLMIAGIENQINRSDFQLNMNTFGDSIRSICFGCAATCTIQEIAGKNLDSTTINHIIKRGKSLGFEIDELASFEYAIDEARYGVMNSLFEFFYSPGYLEYVEYFNANFCIKSIEDFKDQKQYILEYIEKLEKNGL